VLCLKGGNGSCELEVSAAEEAMLSSFGMNQKKAHEVRQFAKCVAREMAAAGVTQVGRVGHCCQVLRTVLPTAMRPSSIIMCGNLVYFIF